MAWVIRQSDRFLYSLDGVSFRVVRVGGYKKPTAFADVKLALWALSQVFGKEHAIYVPRSSKGKQQAKHQGPFLALVSVDRTAGYLRVYRSRWFLEQVEDI